ncbi:MAG: hypothetical protein JEZ14_12085 [Marinilabiliaceae bacterium]|nr:hypothetical protein [Marinilabiliaceae bacterium]
MLPELDRKALQQATQREDLIRKAAAQIIKDFAEFGLEVSFSGDVHNFYQELFSQMKIHVDQLLGEQYPRFLSLLYRIDVSEQQVAMYQQEMADATYIDAVTELIIHRELKKVMIREYFRAHSNNGSEEDSQRLKE